MSQHCMRTGKQYLKKVLTNLQILARLFKTKPIHTNLTFSLKRKLSIALRLQCTKTAEDPTAPGKLDCSTERGDGEGLHCLLATMNQASMKTQLHSAGDLSFDREAGALGTRCRQDAQMPPVLPHSSRHSIASRQVCAQGHPEFYAPQPHSFAGTAPYSSSTVRPANNSMLAKTQHPGT